MFYPSLVNQEFRYLFRLLRPWRSILQYDIDHSVKFSKEKFVAVLDVQNFKPEHITVKVTDDNCVTVEGKHEEKQEADGYVSRHFVKRFVLPQGHDLSKVESKLSSDGILSIAVPKMFKEVEDKARKIPVVETGKPFMQNQDISDKK